MPIKPENKKLYPDNWKEISERIRYERADNRCEHHRIINYDREGAVWGRCNAKNGQPSLQTGSIVVLTVAHLDHNPGNCEDDNLEAMCQRCHLRYDQHHHRACDKTIDLFGESK